MAEEISNIEIDPAGDLIIKVTEYNYSVEGLNGERPVLKEVFMKVSRKVLQENSAMWKTMLNQASPWNESTQLVELKDDTVLSLELWFRRLHGTMTDNMLEIEIDEIWHALEVCRKYFLEIEMLNDWFRQWWGNHAQSSWDLHELRQLLYPAHEFEHSRAFAFVTKELAYKFVGHITEENPTYHQHLHLRHHVIQQLNAAKGSMKTKLHRGLFDVIKKFLLQSCPCKEKALFQYCKGLERTGIWPLEEHGSRKSINTLLEGLTSFRYDAPAISCPRCRYDIGSLVVNRISLLVERYFGGLCLNCMNSSGNSRNVDADYWDHDREEEWDAGCSFRHGQPTWYFSFMGRKADMDAHKVRESQRKRERERERERGY